jgi:hypothetical protein
MADHATRIDQARLDVLLFQPGIALQQEFGRVPGSGHVQDVFHLGCARKGSGAR